MKVVGLRNLIHEIFFKKNEKNVDWNKNISTFAAALKGKFLN